MHRDHMTECMGISWPLFHESQIRQHGRILPGRPDSAWLLVRTWVEAAVAPAVWAVAAQTGQSGQACGIALFCTNPVVYAACAFAHGAWQPRPRVRQNLASLLAYTPQGAWMHLVVCVHAGARTRALRHCTACMGTHVVMPTHQVHPQNSSPRRAPHMAA